MMKLFRRHYVAYLRTALTLAVLLDLGALDLHPDLQVPEALGVWAQVHSVALRQVVSRLALLDFWVVLVERALPVALQLASLRQPLRVL